MNQPMPPHPKVCRTNNGRQRTEPSEGHAAAIALTAPERAALKVFSEFHVAAGKMFCFHGPTLEKHKRSLALLVEKDLLVKEHFASGYSLTPIGYRAMRAVLGFDA
jgi:hypothetical protein